MADASVIETNGQMAVNCQVPEFVTLSQSEMRRIPSPGTQRELKAQTGRSFDELCGADGDQADRMQTMVWAKLRKDRPGLRWEDCADVDIEVEEGFADPTQPVALANSPGSAGSGG
jgi:hypothetical protein